MKTARYLVLGIAAILLCSCASDRYKYELAKRRLNIVTQPSGATVYQVNPLTNKDEILGITPLHEVEVKVIDKAQIHNLPIDKATKLLANEGMLNVIVKKRGYQQLETGLRTSGRETLTHTVKLLPIK